MRSVTEWPPEARHCLRVGSLGDKRVIDDSADQFDVLVVQGNLAVSASQALATWPLDKPVWIDPITYAFAASPVHLQSKGKNGRAYKKSFLSLAEAFGRPYQAAVGGNRKLVPGDFASGSADSVERVLAWQEGIFAPSEEDQKYGAAPISPALLTVPFFPLSITDLSPAAKPDWLDINLQLVAEAAACRDSARLAVGFLATLDVFDHERFDVWLEAYADQLGNLGISHLWWWISDHDEVTTTLRRASRLINSIELLASRGIRVHQAFGGSLSSLTLLRGLSSVAHGVNYWEQKGWEPIASGGLPSARYFHPGLRERLRVPEAIAIVNHLIEDAGEFYEKVCNCTTCRQVVADKLAQFGSFGQVNIKTRRTRGGGLAEFDSPTPEALYRTKMHFLEAKHTEIQILLSDGFDVVRTLRSDAECWGSDVTHTGHLERWALAFELPA